MKRCVKSESTARASRAELLHHHEAQAVGEAVDLVAVLILRRDQAKEEPGVEEDQQGWNALLDALGAELRRVAE